MNKYPPKLDDIDEQYHPTRSTSERYSVDCRLRQVGFAIHARPRNGDPVWTRGGVLFSQRDAELRLPVPKKVEAACQE